MFNNRHIITDFPTWNAVTNFWLTASPDCLAGHLYKLLVHL
jgi:hypothetical protein